MTRDEVVERFITTAGVVAAQPVRAHSMEEVNRILQDLLVQSDSIFCHGVTEIEKQVIIAPERREPDYTRASVCVEEVYGAVAETGSLISASKGGKPVQAGLLPVHHVAVVSKENIYETLEDLFASFHGQLPTNITFETGPSRTADIELTLTIGVHGPERLSIIVI